MGLTEKEKIKKVVEDHLELVDKIKKIISDYLEVSVKQVVPDASFVDDLGADSLDTVELLMELEEAFDIEIYDEIAEKIVTVQDAINCVSKLTK